MKKGGKVEQTEEET